jgi:hypothetical protein
VAGSATSFLVALAGCAQKVSQVGKSAARSAKAGVKSSKAALHHDLQKMGDSTKAAVKKPA